MPVGKPELTGAVVPAAAQKSMSQATPTADEAQALKARLNTARTEIEAALSEAKSAAETILGQAETLLALDAPPEVGEAGIGILTACGFQDITGQRLKKALAALDRIVAEIEQQDFGLGMLQDDPDYAAWQEANLVHGPQGATEALDQNAIDQVFLEMERADLESGGSR